MWHSQNRLVASLMLLRGHKWTSLSLPNWERWQTLCATTCVGAKTNATNMSGGERYWPGMRVQGPLAGGRAECGSPYPGGKFSANCMDFMRKTKRAVAVQGMAVRWV